MKAQIFFLPIETRPSSLPALTDLKGKFWHAGIIYKGKVYECFNDEQNSISNFDQQKKKKLGAMEAVVVEAEINEEKLNSEMNSGTSCGEYVARVVGLSTNTGPTKQYWPEDVYNFISDTK